MIKHRNNRDYVCPLCFRRPNNCICDLYSMELILIDYNLQKIIQKLNDKKIRTMDCCEGHFEDLKPNIYISFLNKIKSAPDEFKIENEKVIRHIYKSKTKKEFEKEKERMIKNIEEWIDKTG